MTLRSDYLTYPSRRPGLDHNRFAHRYLSGATPVAWPNGAKLLIWVTIHSEHFPMDMPTKPFIPIGGMDRVYPSVWDYTMRDYGNRVGIFRLMKVLGKHGVRATVAMNSEVVERYPRLVDEIGKCNWEIAASGVNMGLLHHGELNIEIERELVERSFSTLRKASGQPVIGWHSPAYSESLNTPDIVAANGSEYITDWINDDMPYAFQTASGGLTQLPLSYELSDRKILFLQNQSASAYEQQIGAAFDCLYAEAESKGGRILSLSLSPWVIGQPSKIKSLDRLLTGFMSQKGVAGATSADILRAWKGRAAT